MIARTHSWPFLYSAPITANLSWHGGLVNWCVGIFFPLLLPLQQINRFLCPVLAPEVPLSLMEMYKWATFGKLRWPPVNIPGANTENGQQQHRLWRLREESYLDPHVRQNFYTQVSGKRHINNSAITDLYTSHGSNNWMTEILRQRRGKRNNSQLDQSVESCNCSRKKRQMCYKETEHSKFKKPDCGKRTRVINVEILCRLFWLKNKMSEEK